METIKKIRIKKITVIENENVYDISVMDNHNFFANNVLVHNCAEEPLPNGGACLLGSMNLAAYDFTNYKGWDEFSNDVTIAIEALNQVLDEGKDLHPLQIQKDTCNKYNQIGLGLMGLADALIKQNIKYGSKKAQEFSKKITNTILVASYMKSCYLNVNNKIYQGLKDSEFYKTNILPYIIKDIVKLNPKNSQLLTIAPTGTLSTMLNISGGAEPIFAIEYTRTTKSLHGKDVIYKVRHKLAQQWLDEHPEANNDIKNLPEYFVSSADISVEDRVLMQSALQQNIDASISSTVNLPKEATIEDVYNIYINAWKNNLKGITIFRDGCKRASILTTQTQNNINNFEQHSAPKRPKTLEGDFYKIKVAKEEFGVFVGLMNNKPYEVFAMPLPLIEIENKEIEIPTNTHGNITKIKKRHYTFESNEFNMSNIALDPEDYSSWRAITLYVSAMLRHGMPIESIMKIVNKCDDVITSFHKAIWKVLSKYSKEEESNEKCPECGSKIIREGGCKHCDNCGWSACMILKSNNIYYYD